MNSTHSIDTPWGMSVFGAASVDASPDLARLRVAITQTRPQAGEAFEVTRTGVNQIREVLRGHRVPDAAVSTSRLNLESSWSYRGNDREFLGYECTASFVIELRELEDLETVLVDVVEAGANQVDGVEFDVSTKKELRAQARVGAVAAAREKAALYAEAAGVRLGPVVHITDVDSEQLQNRYRGHGRGSGGGSGDGDLAPGQITVSAGVLLGFSLIEG
ncbi:SIMPL domain-containing protein [Kitasatospora sp. NBC_01287]|uniref:SIMPL domain-containing protein n=1 Tax=Kitasatospora sp. NBC_01287 TaxID=2903573 RepID=UPI002257CAFB|nr:SIMPL domain-containing protein [Kitasatospora sp. NBC_01287]MCX4744989.1 SIMPL domain-containing protein [Kitasatospora sp. NBC_01287]